MKIRKPDYYDQFQCIAGACSDSCCIGWEIDINEEQKEYYRRISSKAGELGNRMKSCIDWEEGHFILQGKEERCPFLNQDHLCDLILGLGEDSLCDICREHPRFYDWFDGLTEVGLGLCCEAAGRLILGKEAPAAFVETESDCDMEDSLVLLFQAREKAIAILQNRTYSIWQRLQQYLDFLEELQDALDFDSEEELRELTDTFESQKSTLDITELFDCAALISLCRSLEAIDDSWTRQLEELADFSASPYCQDDWNETKQMREYEYEHMAVYFVYRYFMKCREDGDVYSRGCLTVFCLFLMLLLDVKTFSETGVLTAEDRVQHAKCISKEIEYSEENLELLADCFWRYREGW